MSSFYTLLKDKGVSGIFYYRLNISGNFGSREYTLNYTLTYSNINFSQTIIYGSGIKIPHSWGIVIFVGVIILSCGMVLAWTYQRVKK